MTLDRLKWLRDDFSDELPGGVLHGHGKYKVRRNWWQGLVGHLEQGLKDGSIPQDLKNEIQDFMGEYTSERFHEQSLTTKGDIEKANSLLNKILK